MNLELLSCEPYDLEQMTRGHGWVDLPPYRWSEGQLSHALELRTGRAVLWSARQIQPGRFCLEVLEDLTEPEGAELTSAVRWSLRLDERFGGFHALAEAHPELHSAARDARGRLLRSPTVWEDAAKTLCTTCTTWDRSRSMAAALCRTWGKQCGDRWTFPTPGAIASASEEMLRKSAGLGYRAKYMHKLACLIADGETDLEALCRSEISTPALREQLLKLPGIGPYAAANLLMLLGRYDEIALDSWLRRVVQRSWFPNREVSDAEIRAAFDRFGPWKALVYWFWEWDRPIYETVGGAV